MTVQEAKESIEYLKMQLTEDLEMICFTGDELKALDMSIQALEEVEQYRALGTVEELKEAMEKQVAKKPIFVDTRFRQRGKMYGECVTLDRCYKCPSCNTHLFHDYDSEIYCKYCGQRLDWEEGGTSD